MPLEIQRYTAHRKVHAACKQPGCRLLVLSDGRRPPRRPAFAVRMCAHLTRVLEKGEKGGHMLIPVRCFTCNAHVGHHWPAYVEEHLASPAPDFEAFCAARGLRRYCCRRMLVAHVDIGREIVEYKYTDQESGTSNWTNSIQQEAEGEKDFLVQRLR